MPHGISRNGLAAPLWAQRKNQLCYGGDRVAVATRGMKLPSLHCIQDDLVQIVSDALHQFFIRYFALRAYIYIDHDILRAERQQRAVREVRTR